MVDDAGGRSSGLEDGARPAAPAEGDETCETETLIDRSGPAAVQGLIGSYRPIRRLGEGGMGEVWEAEQTRPVRRRVAFKLIKQGMDTRAVVARFAAERQALALMEHPAITKVFDAGRTANGRPFFIMELVRGVPVTDYCDRHRLDTRERLELFQRVCDGVQHAHHKTIIHRDLKPSNILVAREGDTAWPKIIDFGVAKATAQPLTEATVHTRLGGMIGTPAYMSPEQAQVTSEGLDTRTDVYSLSVVLYELLVGATPFDPEELRRGGLEEMRRTIRFRDPPSPSTRVSSLGERTQVVAEHRRVDPGRLRSELRGDLDWIVMKGLAKEPERRYDSPLALSRDIGRYLADQPVEARGPSVGYRTRKFVRRHRAAVLAASLVALAIVLGIVGTTVGLARALDAEKQAREAETRARRDAETAGRVSDFLVGLFELDPWDVRPEDVSARDLLERGTERIGDELAEDPLVRARLMHTLGILHQELGLDTEARELLEPALELRRAGLGSGHVEVAESLEALAGVSYAQGRLDEAEALVREALAIQAEQEEADSAQRARWLVSLAGFQSVRGRFDQADETLGEALRLAEEELAPESLDLAFVLSEVGANHSRRGRLEVAEPYFRRTLEILERIRGPEHVDTGISIDHLAVTAAGRGRTDEAIALTERALAILGGRLGAEHRKVRGLLNNLGYFLILEGRYEEARPHLERAVALDGTEPEIRSGRVASRSTNLGIVYWKLGLLEEAIPLFEEANRIRSEVLEPTHPHQATGIWGLANVYRDQGRYGAAEPLYQRALAIREAALPPEHYEVRHALEEYAELLRRMGRRAEAAGLEARIVRSEGA